MASGRTDFLEERATEQQHRHYTQKCTTQRSLRRRAQHQLLQAKSIQKQRRWEYVSTTSNYKDESSRHEGPTVSHSSSKETVRPIDKAHCIKNRKQYRGDDTSGEVSNTELDTHVYIKLVEDSPAVLSLGNRYAKTWTAHHKRNAGEEAFVSISWMCGKQTSVSRNSLDAGLRKQGLLALQLWDCVLKVLARAE